MMFYSLEYEDRIKENIAYRARILRECEGDSVFRAIMIEECKRDIVAFFKNWLWTQTNMTFFSEEMPPEVPFVPFPFQEELIKKLWSDITEGRNIFIEKSRQMGITWLVAGVYLYGFLFYNHRYLIISQKLEYVDKVGDIRSVFEKIRYFLRRLPKWMLPEGFSTEVGTQYNRFLTLSSINEGSITGESANPNAGTGGTYHSIFLDEMAKMQSATQINTACASATPCIVYNSTPVGEGNEYYRMRLKAKKGDIDGVTLHWSLHPLYTREWYEWKSKGMTPEKIAQELEISYNASIEGAVYKRFKSIPHGDVEFGVYNYDYTLPLYCAIDNSHGGADPHAMIVFQTNALGNIIIIDTCQLPSHTSITECASFLAKQPVAGVKMDDYVFGFYSRWQTYKPAIFIADPYDTHSTWNDTSISKEYAKFGIALVTPNILLGGKNRIEEQIRITQNNLNRLKVHERCTDFISAIQNARYPERQETSQSTSGNNKPIHDWTSHYRTALEYAILFITEKDEIVQSKHKAKLPQRVEYGDPITGELRVVYK